MRRLRPVTTKDEFFKVYCGLIRSLMEYACPAFVSLSPSEASRMQRIQKRCLRIKGITEAEDLSARRRRMSASLFKDLQNVDTFLKDLLPDPLPSGRSSIPFCRTSIRRSSFIPTMCIAATSVHLD